MAAIPSNQVDLTPATSGNTTGLHVHTPNGQSASAVNNPSDSPSTPAKTGAKAVTVTVAGVRFSSPS